MPGKLQKRLDKIFICGLNFYRQKFKQNKKCVIFIADEMSPRIEKIGYALKRKGIKIVIFLQKKGIEEVVCNKENVYDILTV